MGEVRNADVAHILREIAVFLEMQGVAFKPRAFEKAAISIENATEHIVELYEKRGLKGLQEIPGVGASIAEKIEEFLKTGKIGFHEELKKKVPVDLNSFTGIEGVGPKSILKLYQKLKIHNVEELEKAAEGGKIREIGGFGAKTEENILKSITAAKGSSGRMPLQSIMPEVHALEERLRNIKGVEQLTIAGSIRRRKEMVGDIDILAVAKDPEIVMEYFVTMPNVARVYAQGPTKSAVRLALGLDADLRVVPKESYGAALNYFTGSKDHNVALRQIAIKKKLKLNEYGLFKGKKQIAGETEEELYAAFGMDYIEPELRENSGELEAATNHTLPNLIGYKDLKGDLQMHTNWTDGRESVETMAKGAAARGLQYIAITDHTKRLAMMRGLDEKRVRAQWKEIEEANKKLRGTITVLKGTECDILKDGSLDLSDEVLAKMDVVGVSVHSYFNLPREAQTERIIRAIRNPHVDILFHPTGRIVGRRPPYDVDMEKIIKVAKETGTILEVDSFERLDLKDEYVRKCVQAGVKIAIDSDAHIPAHFGFLEYGIAQARRGWATAKDVVNTLSLDKMLRSLKKSR
ncbi:MAG: DNA polymerase/3'-5' exonuclease PolX [Candidatus Liptonbacteria bacterium]|nr:DNA polymerase/3'-5' exonuclease PolX [Candidatus Liptonbacteria bacterium]